MAEALDLSMFVTRAPDGTAHMELAVDGIGCAGCIRKIESGLKQTPGIAQARLNFTDRRLAVDWREAEQSAGGVIEALERIGYHAHPFRPQQAESDEALPYPLADEMPRRCGLRRDECHAAVGFGLVRPLPAT